MDFCGWYHPYLKSQTTEKYSTAICYARNEYDARDNVDCSGVVDDDDNNNNEDDDDDDDDDAADDDDDVDDDDDDDDDGDRHLDGFAERDLCSGEEGAGEGRGEESVWETWSKLDLIRYEINMIGYHRI